MLNNSVNGLIDISDVDTYPLELFDYLESNKSLFLDFCETEKYFSELMARDVSFRTLRYSNKFVGKCINCFMKINEMILNHSFLYVHYTRLLKQEIGDIKQNGLKMLTPQLIKQKLDFIDSNSILSTSTVCHLRKTSNKCFSGYSFAERKNMVWVTSLNDTCNDYGGIIHLLNNWGGENIFQKNRETNLLKSIGFPSLVMVNFSFRELDNLFSDLSIAYYVVHHYMRNCHDRIFECSVLYCDDIEYCFDRVNEFYLESDLHKNNIIEIYKLGDSFFNQTISDEIIKDLHTPKII